MELLYSQKANTACALLESGQVAVWPGRPEPEDTGAVSQSESEPRLMLDGIEHLVGCAYDFVCGTNAQKRLTCTNAQAEGANVTPFQRELYELVREQPPADGFAMDDEGIALCVWDANGTRCGSGRAGLYAVPNLGEVTEVALGEASLGVYHHGRAACARDVHDVVRCWDWSQRTTPQVQKRPGATLTGPSGAPTPPPTEWSPADRERLAIVGATCAPAYAPHLKTDGTIALGCAENGPADAPPSVVTHLEGATALRGNFRTTTSDDAVVVQADGKRTWVLRESGAWKAVRAHYAAETHCLVAEGEQQKDLLVCGASFPDFAGERASYSVIAFGESSSEQLVGMFASSEPWELLCAEYQPPLPSYVSRGFTTRPTGGDAAADLQIFVRRLGWTPQEAPRAKRSAHVAAACACKSEACKQARPPVPQKDFTLTFVREGDSFIPTKETRALLQEIRQQDECGHEDCVER